MRENILRRQVAPSILSANSMNILSEIRSVEQAGAGLHHLDVMDGHFVPNLTFGLHLLKELKKYAKLPIDVHIMVTNPDEVAMSYVESGADVLTFHIEAARHAHRLIKTIQARGALAGVAINPMTPISSLAEAVKYVDLVNIMSVNPGFSGQSFIEGTLDKIVELRSLLVKVGRWSDVVIQVDGGIDQGTAALVCGSGASLLVAGAYIYGSENRNERVKALNEAIQANFIG